MFTQTDPTFSVALIAVVLAQTQNRGKITETRGTSVRNYAGCMHTWTNDFRQGETIIECVQIFYLPQTSVFCMMYQQAKSFSH